MAGDEFAAQVETSPISWGRGHACLGHVNAFRSTPTPVGKTARWRAPASTGSDHPHTRGENALTHWRAGFPPGPSPHPWGKQPLAPERPRSPRTIPTPVGKTSSVPGPRPPRADHPHTRGENRITTSLLLGDAGPSPHPWGKPRASPCSPPSRADHPHTRGENAELRVGVGLKSGPSPHPWGKQGAHPHASVALRTIPTPVGKTAPRDRARRSTTDHPHTRGENCAYWTMPCISAGPSPHPWGKRGVDSLPA